MDYRSALKPAANVVVDVIKEHLGTTIQDAPHLFDAVVRDVVREVGRQASEALAALIAERAVDAAKAAGFRVERSPRIEFLTVFGTVAVKSPYLRKQQVGGRPVNEALRVRGGGLTRSMERTLCDFGLDSSFEKAAAKVAEHYGVRVHRTTVLRTVQKHGQSAEIAATMNATDAQCARPPTGPGTPCLIAEMDGSCVRTGTLVPGETAERTPIRNLPRRRRVTEWRDLRLGFVRGEGDETRRYVGGIHDFHEVTMRLLSESIRLGWTEETFTVRVTDGGLGIREALDHAFPKGQHILDKPHLVHHLYEAAQDAFGVDIARHATERWTRVISMGGVADVISELTALGQQGSDRATQASGYLKRFEDAVNYDDYAARGFPIGSGEIESAHKSQVQARMKLPGTWWTPQGANRVLALRLTRSNDRWDTYWKAA